ncbi:MAG: TldD/PmbA family protein [Candidatus Hodarchaeales archaeon]
MEQEKEFVDRCLTEIEQYNVSFADTRVFQRFTDVFNFRMGTVETTANDFEFGFNVRVLLDGAWGYAASSKLALKDIPEVVQQAVKVAKASGKKLRKPVELTDEPVYTETYATPYKIDPFTVDPEEKLDILRNADEIIRESGDQIRVSRTFIDAFRIRAFLGNTEGSRINQEQTFVGVAVQATAIGTDVQTRFSGNYLMRGFEYANSEFNFEEEAERVGKEALLLINEAKKCPEEKTALILGPHQLGLTIHESTGHPTELDRVMGFEADFAGTSFLTTDKFGSNYRYGSDIVNLVCDPTLKYGLGSIRYDDEGVQTKRFHIVENGIFKNYMTDRELAYELGYQHSFGNARMANYNRLPIIRMGNLHLEPDPEGPKDIDELIAETPNGVYADFNKSWSIDDKRVNFQFGTEMGWRIKNGEKADLLKNVNFNAMTPEFWASCDRITKTAQFVANSAPNCGKGKPMQSMWVSHGGGWARFQNTSVFSG